MLKYEVTDISGKSTQFRFPVRAGIISSYDAPADSLSAVFAAEGKIPLLKTIVVSSGSRIIFSGEIDEQTETVSSGRHLLELRARSRESILLDNEARPQTYCMPSMPLLMKRHFEALGFEGFIGTEKAFNGELNITKGMSEWEVLDCFCRKFVGTVPRLTVDGIIDISGEDNGELILIGNEARLLSSVRHRKRHVLMSELFVRTHIRGDYDMKINDSLAQSCKVARRRYVNAVRTMASAKKIIESADNAFESYENLYSGCIICRPGDKIRSSSDSRIMRVREVRYLRDSSGEKTRIFAEVTGNVDIKESEAV